MVTTLVISEVPPRDTLDLLDAHLPTYDVVLTEHLVVDADTVTVFAAAKNFDFMTTQSLLVTAMMTARGLPSRLTGRPVATPPSLMLARDPGALPGWLLLGEVPGREVVFGAVGTFWKPDIQWHDIAAEQFASFDEPGWGKIACHLLVRPDGPNRSILSYECRTATTDPVSRAQMSRYWWLIRPFVAYVLRAVIRTIRNDVGAHA
ncbi:hypothetical protein [Nocardioides sp.]|uniref:hypothetical protein n=1 Tax=Nocardioides sp. TaxID=35761 RepID=UPI002606CA3A|nr:hypothetical protein [Nocardioides sp.]